MTVLTIVQHPNEILQQIAEPVTVFGNPLEAFTNDLIDTIQHHGGIGLSAPQVNRSSRIIVTISDQDRTPTIYINPIITSFSKKRFVQESCLSLPGITGTVTRFVSVSVTAQHLDGSSFEKNLQGMDAVCAQHEIDHLNGILFVDRFSAMKKLSMRLFNNFAVEKG